MDNSISNTQISRLSDKILDKTLLKFNGALFRYETFLSEGYAIPLHLSNMPDKLNSSIENIFSLKEKLHNLFNKNYVSLKEKKILLQELLHGYETFNEYISKFDNSIEWAWKSQSYLKKTKFSMN